MRPATAAIITGIATASYWLLAMPVVKHLLQKGKTQEEILFLIAAIFGAGVVGIGIFLVNIYQLLKKDR